MPRPGPRPDAPTTRGGRGPLALLLVVVVGALTGLATIVAVATVVLVAGPRDGGGPADAPVARAQTPDDHGADDHGADDHGAGGRDDGGPVAEADVRALDDGYAVWDRTEDGTPVRWDPCRPIELVLSGTDRPPDLDEATWRADVAAAAALIADASGLDLRITGTTEERPAAARGTLGADDGWAPVLIGWADPGAGELPMRDADRAIAVPVAVRAEGYDAVFVTGQIVLNRQRDDLQPGSADRADSWGAVLAHELGHLVGLDHVDDPDQLMHRYPGSGPVALGPGDRAGLTALGARAGCLDGPPADDLDVRVPTR